MLAAESRIWTKELLLSAVAMKRVSKMESTALFTWLIENVRCWKHPFDASCEFCEDGKIARLDAPHPGASAPG
ncbi:hypothetical protein BZG21_38985 [Escherichia coli]|nr:hypothetical protein [Escherichia coli]